MKRSYVVSGLAVLSLVTFVSVSGPRAAAQATARRTGKTATSVAKSGLSAQQAAGLKLAWDNLHRGYADLLSTPPDVKGDTSKLEGHMRAAMNALHEVDAKAMPAAEANIPIEDKGHTRQFILDAVRGHLEKAQRVIDGLKVEDPHVKEAVANITVAGNDVMEIGKTPAKK